MHWACTRWENTGNTQLWPQPFVLLHRQHSGWDCGLVSLQWGTVQGRLCSSNLKQAPRGASALCASPPSQGALLRLSPHLIHNSNILNKQKRLHEDSDHCSQGKVSGSHLRKTRLWKAHMKHMMSLIEQFHKVCSCGKEGGATQLSWFRLG